jgi:hypothetical protein
MEEVSRKIAAIDTKIKFRSFAEQTIMKNMSKNQSQNHQPNLQGWVRQQNLPKNWMHQS